MCVGCPGEFVCCGKAWGVCVCTRPTWKRCCTKVPDVDCEKKNDDCAKLKAPLEYSLQVAITTRDVIKAILSVARGDTKKAPMDLAIAARDGVRETYEVGVDALG